MQRMGGGGRADAWLQGAGRVPGTSGENGKLWALFGGGRKGRVISLSPPHNLSSFFPILSFRIYVLTSLLRDLSSLKSSSPVPFSTTTAALAQVSFLQKGE